MPAVFAPPSADLSHFHTAFFGLQTAYFSLQTTYFCLQIAKVAFLAHPVQVEELDFAH